MTTYEFLSSECAGIILNAVRVKGRLWIISENSSINRKFLNRKMFPMLRVFQLVRLLYWTSEWMSRERFVAMGSEMFGRIWDINNEGYEDESNVEI